MKLRLTLLSLIATALCSTAIVSTSFAQAGDGATLTPEQRIEKRLAHEQKKLGLSDDQVAKLKAILEQNVAKLRADRQAMRSAAAGDAKQDARKTLMSDMKAMREQMKAVLTPEQLKKWKEERIDQINRREERLEKRKEHLEKVK